ncbi:MAG: DUF2786 domain-containing protein [Eggerthellaceae bacterium]|nr:DUF2786 domain-containing protein [Eggerthellaceae bacterium]
MQREEAIGKIRKLLALADGNANENEAVAAALKAQKLIAEFDVQAAEISDGVPQGNPVEVRTAAYSRADWRNWLASAVADGFRCKRYVSMTSLGKRRVEKEQVFVGFELDARAASMTYERLAEVGERLAREECSRRRRLHGSARGVRNSFLHGYVAGIRSELEKQCQALLLVTPKAVADYYAGLDLGNARSRRLSLVQDASDAGRAAGRDAVRAGRIGSSDAYLLPT